jgi:hypothetical protein
MVRTAPAHEDPELTSARQTGSLAALALSLALVVAGLYLVDALRANAAFQDCVLEGRMQCR